MLDLSGVPLWGGSVEDAFVKRAKIIRREHYEQGAESHEETETA